MRSPSVPPILLALLLLASTAAAHGEPHGVILRVTDEGGSAAIVAGEASGTPEAGQAVTVSVYNQLDAQQDFMVHLDAGGNPGAVVAGVEPVGPGQTIEVQVDVPEGATGLWYMTLQDNEESARLFMEVVEPAAEGEDSPGPALGVLLGTLAFLVLVRRR